MIVSYDHQRGLLLAPFLGRWRVCLVDQPLYVEVLGEGLGSAGFFPTMISNLGEPDKLVVNPHYKSGPPSSLYFADRVLQYIAENSQAVNDAAAKRASRKAAAMAGVATKTARAVGFAESVNASTPGSNGLISTIRHEYTNYHAILVEFEGKTGNRDAYDALRVRLDKDINDAIEAKYGTQWDIEV